jgi:hypothetical protein
MFALSVIFGYVPIWMREIEIKLLIGLSKNFASSIALV